ncbi:dihydroxy-acid dehydratase, partial [Acinetobacter baumannii]
GFVIRELLDAGLMHEDVLSVAGSSLRPYTFVPRAVGASGEVVREPLPAASGDDSVVRPAGAPFSPTGGLKLLDGNLGRAVIKVSAVP